METFCFELFISKSVPLHMDCFQRAVNEEDCVIIYGKKIKSKYARRKKRLKKEKGKMQDGCWGLLVYPPVDAYSVGTPGKSMKCLYSREL